mmetsp:Transcript_16432/g.42108  ORF Transcript_16432/g.42108 Transcript_16432/m.42108 type:complete len:470 (-) Transcript_16432:203-1612(-)
MMFASTVPFTKKRFTTTERVCPMRHARPIACSSSDGLRAGSSRNTWLAAVRLMPTAPARMDRRNTVVGGSPWKSAIAAARLRIGMPPSMVRYAKPSPGRRSLSHSMVLLNWENTSALAPLSLARMACSSATRVRSLESQATTGAAPGSAAPAAAGSATVSAAATPGCSADTSTAARHSGQVAPQARSSAPTMHSRQNQCPQGVRTGASGASRQTGHCSCSAGSATGWAPGAPLSALTALGAGSDTSAADSSPPDAMRRRGSSSDMMESRCLEAAAAGFPGVAARYDRKAPTASACEYRYISASPGVKATSTTLRCSGGSASTVSPPVVCAPVCRTMMRDRTYMSSALPGLAPYEKCGCVNRFRYRALKNGLSEKGAIRSAANCPARSAVSVASGVPLQHQRREDSSATQALVCPVVTSLAQWLSSMTSRYHCTACRGDRRCRPAVSLAGSLLMARQSEPSVAYVVTTTS